MDEERRRERGGCGGTWNGALCTTAVCRVLYARGLECRTWAWYFAPSGLDVALGEPGAHAQRDTAYGAHAREAWAAARGAEC